MLFLHTSDWHLGATEGEYDLGADQRFFIDEICRIIQERQVDAVLLAGDVYDRSVASAAAIRLYDFSYVLRPAVSLVDIIRQVL